MSHEPNHEQVQKVVTAIHQAVIKAKEEHIKKNNLIKRSWVFRELNISQPQNQEQNEESNP